MPVIKVMLRHIKLGELRESLRKTLCILSRCLRVVGSLRSSSSSSLSQPSTVTLRLVLNGFSSSSGRALTMYLALIKPNSPLEQKRN